MPPVPRETVISAVNEYGQAWTTQDPKRIGRLFTNDAVYIERAFDRKATFRGRAAIEQYWKYQIVGKQANIVFRHVESEMVRDAEKPVAVVKWLAEFDNRREKRGESKTHKRVRFCQMAKLIFAEGGKIRYLEEYVQPMGGSGVRWPGLEASDKELERRIRFDPDPPKPPVQCERCFELFASRTKLFCHLNTTDAREDGQPGCVPNAETQALKRYVTACLSLSYSQCREPEALIRNAVETLAVDENAKEEGFITVPKLIWAVPTEFTISAVVNAATIQLPRQLFEAIPVELLAGRLNRILSSCNNGSVKIHTAGLADIMFVPKRRELEKYTVYIPWTAVTSKPTKRETTLMDALPNESAESTSPSLSSATTNEKRGGFRRPLEETMASEFVGLAFAKQLKQGTRIMTTNLDNIKIRAHSMQEPWHRWCRIAITMRQTTGGCVEQLVKSLLLFARDKVTEEELVEASLATMSENSNGPSGHREPQLSFPSDFICLNEPLVSKFETKTGVPLCSGALGASQELKESVNASKQEILRCLESKEGLLIDWATRMGWKIRQ